MEEGHEEEAPSGRVQDEGAGPEVLVDGEDGVPGLCQEQGDESGGRHVGGFPGGRMRGGAEVFACEDTGQSGGDGGDIVEEADCVVDAAGELSGENGAVEPGGEVAGLGEVAGREAGCGGEGEDGPVAEEEAGEPDVSGTGSGVEEEEAGEGVGDPDAAEDAHDAEVGEGSDLEAVVIDHAEDEEDESPAEDFSDEFAFGRPLVKGGSQRIGGRDAADEDEEGEDEVVGGEAVPVGMVELVGEGLPEGGSAGFGEGVEDFLGADDPEHVEAAEGVEGGEAWGGTGSHVSGLWRVCRPGRSGIDS